MGKYSKPVRVEAEVMSDVASAILLSSVIGSLEILIHKEKPKTRRYREIEDAIKQCCSLLKFYKKSEEYDLVNLGVKFFELMDSHLQVLFVRGVQIVGEKLLPVDKFEPGDVVMIDESYLILREAEGSDGYVVRPLNAAPGVEMFSLALWPNDPWMLLGEPLQWRMGDVRNAEKEEHERKVADKRRKVTNMMTHVLGPGSMRESLNQARILARQKG